MTATERRRHDGRVQRRPGIVTAVALLAPMFWLTVAPCAPARAAAPPTVAAPAPDSGVSAPTHASGHVQRHKEGRVAVAASVIGIIIVVVCIVGLGSLSVRRRTRDRPPAGDPGQGGPPGRHRGLFDEWFRPPR